MAIHNVLGKDVVWWDPKDLDIHWTSLSHFVTTNYPEIDNSDKTQLVEIFKSSFGFLIELFLKETSEEKNAAFYVYVFKLHEDSLEVYNATLGGAALDSFDDTDFAVYRRVLKLILEQACNESLMVGVDLRVDIESNQHAYQAKVESLMYLGEWIYYLADLVAEMDLIGNVHGIEVGEDEIISITTEKVITALKNYTVEDYSNHTSKVEIDIDGGKDLFLAHRELTGIEEKEVFLFLASHLKDPNLKFGLIPKDELVKRVAETNNYNIDDLQTFIGGLLLSKQNKLSIQDSVLNPQKCERYLYRPFLLLDTNLGECILTSIPKLEESIRSLSSNAIPWGASPSEWGKILGFNDFVNRKKDNHDALLEDAVEKLFLDHSLLFDRNIKSFQRHGQPNLRCDIPGVGEIDLICLNPTAKKIYVVECKHNRSRFDMVSFRKEHNNFIGKYEGRLKSKETWVKDNIDAVTEHFELKYSGEEIDLTDHIVEGVFIINAPNFYLYNGSMPCFTLSTLQTLIEEGIDTNTIEISIKNNGDIYLTLARPYFYNAINQN